VKNSGQAAVELAIFGSLILLAFSVLLMYGQRLDSQQQVKMDAFRRALAKAYDRNGSVTYTLKREGRSFNLFSGFGQGQASTVGSTASVLWQKGMPGIQKEVDIIGQRSEGYAYNAINDIEVGNPPGPEGVKGLPRYAKQQININGKDVIVWVTPGIYSEDQTRKEVYDSSTQKKETPSSIKNIRTSELRDTITITPRVRVDFSKSDARTPHVVPLPVYRYEGESFHPEGESLQTVKSLLKDGKPIRLGATPTNDNRVDYKKLGEGEEVEPITRERTWETEN
jgi:hypothetical protein